MVPEPELESEPEPEPEPDEDEPVAKLEDPVGDAVEEAEEDVDVTAFLAGQVKSHFGVVERLSEMAN